MKLSLTVSCDDINPHPQYRLLGTPAEKWFRALNDEFGVKFTLFCPSNYHRQHPISKHKGWIQELNSTGFLELCCHGHFHQTSRPNLFGEMEFAEIHSENIALERIQMIEDEWSVCGFNIGEMGWRNPGWCCSVQSKNVIQYNFKYVALHNEHNQGMNWNCKTFFGHDGIQQENISVHNLEPDGESGMIMFQSHIYGKHNHNVWNEHNYEQLRLSLTHLVEAYNIEFKTLKECL